MSVSAALALLATLALGAWLVAWIGAPAAARAGPLAPLRDGAARLVRPQATTEAPDALTRFLAPVTYLALSAVALSVVPLLPSGPLVDSPVGIVVWGSCEALTVVAVFLHGWSPNAPFPLIGAYRYAAIGLPVMLPSMFVLIAAALPAESLSIARIVESQAQDGLWTAIRQPLGLPLFLLVGLSLTLRGPFDYADGADLAGGTSAETGGAGAALWQLARLCMLISFSAVAAAVFLGGPSGPGLPGLVWMWLKTGAVAALVVAAGRHVGRLPPSRMLTLLWTVALPLSFLDLAIAGAIAL